MKSNTYRLSLQALLVLGLGACAWLKSSPAPEPARAGWLEVEYFQRWTRAEFEARHAWLNRLLPAAHAELPPQYQSAFSLHFEAVPARQEIKVVYHFQQVTQPETHVWRRQTLGQADYARFSELLTRPLGCQVEVEPGWVGPAPSYLVLNFLQHDQWLFVGGARGPAGPGRQQSDLNQRHYLCQDDLLTYLNEVRQRVQAEASSGAD